MQKKIKQRALRRTNRVRKNHHSRGELPRVTVFKSLKNISVQVIDDASGKTVASLSSLAIKDKAGDKKAIAKQVGLELGKKVQKESIDRVFFDRGSYKYHGRVAALADGLREAGLKF